MEAILARAVVSKVLDMCLQQVTNEVGLVVNFKKDFECLKNKIEQINAFRREANEEHSKQKDSAKQWLQNVRDVAWQAEDILEECVVESKYGNITQSCILSCNELSLRYKLAQRIKGVKARLSSIVEDAKELTLFDGVVSTRIKGAASSSTSEKVDRRRSCLLPSDSQPVGIQSKLDDILSLLDSPEFPVIAVVGMGGIGKTYLLQHAYKDRERRYDKKQLQLIWLSVSSSSVSMLQRDLASRLELTKEIITDKVDKRYAEELIYKKLAEKKSLIVLDDVRTAPREDDLLTKLGLPTGNDSPCKIVVTTRNKEVAQNLNAKIYEMESLSDDDSRKLFCLHAFGEESTPPQHQHLEDVANKIVKKCRNLPLAIKTTAASLKHKKIPSEWELKLSQLQQVVILDENPIMDILKVSYDPLPAHLKECFAYLSFFPENEKIDCEYLINLWIAEGVIQKGENEFYTALKYLDELANLCLVEVSEEVEDGILTKYCEVHDLVLNFAKNIWNEYKCAFAVEEAFPKVLSKDRSDWCRILLAKKDIDSDAISQINPVCSRLLRTLSLSSNSCLTNIPANFFATTTVLRVLDLSSTKISTLPECVGKMKLLKVLNLTDTAIKEVPECVRNLKSLWFLDISRTPAESTIPVWMNELKLLQHLLCLYSYKMPKEISKLDTLHTLRTDYLQLSIAEDEWLRLEDVAKMTELRQIKFEVKHEEELKTMSEKISILVKMRRLGIRNAIGRMQGDTESVLPQFPEEMKKMAHLERLELCDFAVPRWICCFQKLTELRLVGCHCSNYPELQTMPSLVHLMLEGNKSCRELPKAFGNSLGFSQLCFLQIKNFDLLEEFPDLQTISSLVSLKLEGVQSCRELPKAFGNSSGFPRLRFLKISGFSLLEEFPELQDGAMARLEKFQLSNCASVKKVEGLDRLKRLKEFKYDGCGRELRGMLKEGGEYWKKIKCVNPNISL